MKMKINILALIAWALAGISTISSWNILSNNSKLLDYILCWVSLISYIVKSIGTGEEK